MIAHKWAFFISLAFLAAPVMVPVAMVLWRRLSDVIGSLHD